MKYGEQLFVEETFILNVKQPSGPLSSNEPTIQFKYWKHGDLDGAQLLALRTSAAGAATKEINLYVKAPTNWPTLNWEYHYNDKMFTIDQSPDDVGTGTPSGTAPNYYGDELFAIDGGNVGIGTTSPARPLHVNDVMRLEPRSSAPGSPSMGDIYMHDGTGTPNYPVLRVHDGTTWQDLW